MAAQLGSDLFPNLTMDPLFVKDSVELKLGLYEYGCELKQGPLLVHVCKGPM